MRKEIVVEKVVNKKSIQLPNHIEQNTFIEKRVLKLLEIIPYDMILKELLIDKNSFRMEVNLLNKDTFIKTLQPQILEDYDRAEISFKKEKKSLLEATVLAEGLKEKKIIKFKDYKDNYTFNEFVPIITVTEQIKMLFPKDAIIQFKSSFKSEVVTFNYFVNVVIKKPLDFFEIINNLNNELYSINISYPLSFIKTEAGIELEFILQFHQAK